jgi:phosphohistidine phosphatase SixA/8-oxo-dGTP pyrophosphatase MutT (NUDIX family)
MMIPTIVAAGGVIWRRDINNEVEVLLVHRPRYDDWSLPKGKLEEGEALISCAYREVLEETGLSIKLGPFIGSVEYYVPDGLKSVSYWCASLAPDKSTFHPNEEVDQIIWLDLESAISQATRDSDKEILQRFAAIPYDSSALIMLRHAKALERTEWQGGDEDRPLQQVGQLQAKRMLSLYQVFGVEEIHTSDAVRCLDTVAQMAKSLQLTPVITNAVSEYTYEKSKEKSIDYAKDLIKRNKQVILCSHNPVLPRMMEKLTKKIDFDYPDNKLLPAEAWVLFHNKKEVLQIDRIAAPSV